MTASTSPMTNPCFNRDIKGEIRSTPEQRTKATRAVLKFVEAGTVDRREAAEFLEMLGLVERA